MKHTKYILSKIAVVCLFLQSSLSFGGIFRRTDCYEDGTCYKSPGIVPGLFGVPGERYQRDDKKMKYHEEKDHYHHGEGDGRHDKHSDSDRKRRKSRMTRDNKQAQEEREIEEEEGVGENRQ